MTVNRLPDTPDGVLLPDGRTAEKIAIRDGYSGALNQQYHTQVLTAPLALPAGALHLIIRNVDNAELLVNGTTIRSGESYFQEADRHLLPSLKIEGVNYQIVVIY